MLLLIGAHVQACRRTHLVLAPWNMPVSMKYGFTSSMAIPSRFSRRSSVRMPSWKEMAAVAVGGCMC